MRRIAVLLEAVAAVLLLALMAVTGIDVVGRYLLNAPLPGAFETTQLLLGALVFAAMPLVGRAGGHVEVDLLVGLLPARAMRRLGLFAGAVSAVTLLYFAWQLGRHGAQQWEDGARSISLGIPFGPIAGAGALFLLLAALYGLLREFRPAPPRD